MFSVPKFLLLGGLLLAAPLAAEQLFSSGKQRVHLLELYTSEGCSSCPPADRWLSGLLQDSRLWQQLVPVAFHVDYWNYIGWPDRFASADFSERQRRYARAENLTTVYTPGFLLNGNEWRSFFGLRKLSLQQEDAGELQLKLEGDEITASYTPAVAINSGVEINIALLGFDLQTEVKAGENRGETLRHDFTVLAIKRLVMQPGDMMYSVVGHLPVADISAPRLALAAWVSKTGRQTPLQATGGWLQN